MTTEELKDYVEFMKFCNHPMDDFIIEIMEQLTTN